VFDFSVFIFTRVLMSFLTREISMIQKKKIGDVPSFEFEAIHLVRDILAKSRTEQP